MKTYRLDFITPLFSRGSYEDRPEIRPASIRGQLHWWFRALGGNYTDEKAIFGGVHDDAVASKVVIRASNLPTPDKKAQVNTLPHKNGNQASPKWAFQAGAGFDLHVAERLGGLNPTLSASFDRALRAWLHLGTLGLRATRAAGSFVWSPSDSIEPSYPASFEDYDATCRELVKNTPLRFGLLGSVYPNAEAARRDVSDTLGGRDDSRGQNDLAMLHDPLGKIHGGRKTSPLRFRILHIGNQYRIAAIWDGRDRVTGNRPADLPGIIKLLAERKPNLGGQLQESALAR